MNDTCRQALTQCMELAYNFAKTDYIADGMVNDEALRESMKSVLTHPNNQIKLMDFTKKMLELSNVLIPPKILQNFMDSGVFSGVSNMP